MSEPGLSDFQDYLDDECYGSVHAFLLDKGYDCLKKTH